MDFGIQISLPSQREGRKAASCTPDIGRSFENHTGDNVIFLVRFHSNLEREPPEGGVGDLPSLFPFPQPHERTYAGTII
ncbi:hypothetical protein TNCV_1108971 [Trichonephila clavipes]|nr:hypothetical protein TNCV_1108971 [Trichonephila clavipes]